MTRGTRALIHTGALRHNLRRVRELAPRQRVVAMVKANGYGHGLLRVAQALEEADAFGVACPEEALALREAGFVQRLLLMEGPFDAADLAVAARHDLEPVIHHPGQVAWLEAADGARPLRTWLKVDSGMHRLGFAPGEVAAVWARLQACPAARPVGLVTHLACADEPENPCTRDQLGRLQAAAAGLGAELSIANSAGILAWPEVHGDWVRPGIMLYGVSPFPGRHGEQDGLRPAMTLVSRLIAVHRLRRGDRVGYSGTWSCPEDMPVGVVAIGYGDGYPRHVPNATPVLVNGRRVPLVGRVSMDMLTVDLRGQPDARVGDPVVLWGEGLPVEEVAEHAGTIGYELLCQVTGRVRFESD